MALTTDGIRPYAEESSKFAHDLFNYFFPDEVQMDKMTSNRLIVNDNKKPVR